MSLISSSTSRWYCRAMLLTVIYRELTSRRSFLIVYACDGWIEWTWLTASVPGVSSTSEHRIRRIADCVKHYSTGHAESIIATIVRYSRRTSMPLIFTVYWYRTCAKVNGNRIDLWFVFEPRQTCEKPIVNPLTLQIFDRWKIYIDFKQNSMN